MLSLVTLEVLSIVGFHGQCNSCFLCMRYLGCVCRCIEKDLKEKKNFVFHVDTTDEARHFWESSRTYLIKEVSGQARSYCTIKPREEEATICIGEKFTGRFKTLIRPVEPGVVKALIPITLGAFISSLIVLLPVRCAFPNEALLASLVANAVIVYCIDFGVGVYYAYVYIVIWFPLLRRRAPPVKATWVDICEWIHFTHQRNVVVVGRDTVHAALASPFVLQAQNGLRRSHIDQLVAAEQHLDAAVEACVAARANANEAEIARDAAFADLRNALHMRV